MSTVVGLLNFNSSDHQCDSDGITVDGEWWMCNEGALYGPCEDTNCGGTCEYKGDCECECHGGDPTGEEAPNG